MASAGTVVVRLAADLKGFINGLRRAEESLRNTGRRIKTIGGQLTTGITLPLGFAAGAAIKFASDFEDSMRKIVNLVGVGSDQVQQWRQDILDLAPAVGVGPRELADALFFITSAGERGSAALDILETSAKASAIGLGSVKTVADATVSVMQAYKQENISASRAANILTAAVREGKVEANQLAGAIGKVLPIASSMGVTFDQVGGFLASFTRVGADAFEAATALRGVLSALAQGTPKQRQAFEDMGTSIEAFRQEVQDKGLAQALVDLVDGLGGNVSALREVIPRVRALTGALATARSQGQDFVDLTDRITEAGDLIAEGFENIQDTTSQTFKEFLGKLESVAIKLGDQLAPAFDKLVESMMPLLDFIADLVNAFASLPEGLQTAILAVAGFITALGPLLFIIGGIIQGLGSLGLAATAIGALLSPGGAVVAGLGIVAGLGLTIASNYGDAKRETQAYINKLKKIKSMDMSAVNAAMAGALRDQKKAVEELKDAQEDQDRVNRLVGSSTGAFQQRIDDARESLRRANERIRELNQRAEALREQLNALGGDDDGGDPTEATGRMSLEQIEEELRKFEMLKRMGRDVFEERSQFIQRQLLDTEKFTERWFVLKDAQLSAAERLQSELLQAHEERMDLQKRWLEFRIRTGQVALQERIQQIEAELSKEEGATERALELERERFDLISRLTSQQIQSARRTAKENEQAAIRSLQAWKASLEESGRLTPTIASDIDKAIRDIQDTVDTGMGNMESRLIDAGLRMGANIAFSLARGVRDKEEFVKRVLLQFAQIAIISVLKSALSIASPSQVTMSIGEQISEGLAKGIERGSSKVERASQSLAAIVPNALRGTSRIQRHLQGAQIGRSPAFAASGRTSLALRPVSDIVPTGSRSESELLRMVRDATRSDPVLAARQPELVRIVGEALLEWKRGGGRV